MYFNEQQKAFLTLVVTSPAARSLLKERRESALAGKRVEADKAFVTRILPDVHCKPLPGFEKEHVVVDPNGAQLAPSAKAPRDAWGNVTAGLFKAYAGKI